MYGPFLNMRHLFRRVYVETKVWDSLSELSAIEVNLLATRIEDYF